MTHRRRNQSDNSASERLCTQRLPNLQLHSASGSCRGFNGLTDLGT